MNDARFTDEQDMLERPRDTMNAIAIEADLASEALGEILRTIPDEWENKGARRAVLQRAVTEIDRFRQEWKLILEALDSAGL